jgi:hypothetical protein
MEVAGADPTDAHSVGEENTGTGTGTGYTKMIYLGHGCRSGSVLF